MEFIELGTNQKSKPGIRKVVSLRIAVQRGFRK